MAAAAAELLPLIGDALESSGAIARAGRAGRYLSEAGAANALRTALRSIASRASRVVYGRASSYVTRAIAAGTASILVSDALRRKNSFTNVGAVTLFPGEGPYNPPPPKNPPRRSPSSGWESGGGWDGLRKVWQHRDFAFRKGLYYNRSTGSYQWDVDGVPPPEGSGYEYWSTENPPPGFEPGGEGVLHPIYDPSPPPKPPSDGKKPSEEKKGGNYYWSDYKGGEGWKLYHKLVSRSKANMYRRKRVSRKRARPVTARSRSRSKKRVHKLAPSRTVPQIRGKGDYTIKSNTLASRTLGSVPAFGQSSIRVKHREFVQNVATTTAFSVSSFLVNPGNAFLFPWLSKIAQNFEYYQVHGLVFYYRSTSGNALNSTNASLGRVVGMVDMNSAETAPINLREMYASNFCASGPPSKDLIFPVECDPSLRPSSKLYVRNPFSNQAVDNSASSDVRMTDLGVFHLATDGSQAAYTAGELHVSIDVSFFSPTGENHSAVNVTDFFELAGMGVSAADKFGTTQQGPGLAGNHSKTKLTIGGEVTTGGRYIFPKSAPDGVYIIECYWKGSAATIGTIAGAITYGGALAVVKQFANGAGGEVQCPTSGVSSAFCTLTLCVKLSNAHSADDTARTVDLDAAAIPTSVTEGYLLVNRMSSDSHQTDLV